MFLAYASPKGRALIDRELYLPKSWTDDPGRCREAGVPGDVQFSSKTDLARLMLGRALDAGVPVSWATADEAYGKEGKFREWLEQRRVSYVVAVPKSQAVAGDAGKSRADVLTGHAPDQHGSSRAAATAPKAPGSATGRRRPCPEDGTEPPGWQRFLLVRRSLTPNSKGELELAYYLCCRPGRHPRRGPDPRRRVPLGRRGVLPGGQEPGRPRTTTRSVATTPGTATPPSPSSPTPTSPSPPRPPQKPWQRPHPGHARARSAVSWHT